MFVYNIQSKKNSSSACQDFAQVKIAGSWQAALQSAIPCSVPRFWMLIQQHCLVKHWKHRPNNCRPVQTSADSFKGTGEGFSVVNSSLQNKWKNKCWREGNVTGIFPQSTLLRLNSVGDLVLPLSPRKKTSHVFVQISNILQMMILFEFCLLVQCFSNDVILRVK